MAYNNPIKKKSSSCVQLKDHKGKTSGIMMEGSVAYQEETKKVEEAKAKKLDKKQEIQEKKDLLTEIPSDNRGVGEMSPYKMDNEGSALQNTGARPATAEEKAEMRKKKAGANFFPPSNPQAKSSFKQPILDSNSPGYDQGRFLYDSDKDGDTVFSDLNQDGTMLGRAVKKLFE